MGHYELTIEPNEITISGRSFRLQGDPSATDAWRTLLDQEIDYTDEKFRLNMLDALCQMAETPDDAATLLDLDLGTATLRKVVDWYVKEVTGFPTQPSEPSKKSSPRTSRT